ncbi:MAG: MATE family efflux transporter [Oscillospiraceae bacterium]|nr:MATE family efflux transporter [Oscillospiraceae bacterium]
MFFERSSDFYKKTARLMLPVMLQQLITIGINFMDNVMVGGFGEINISAVSFGNQFYSFFQFICMGLGSGVVVLSSQFWGRKELDAMRTSAAIGLRVALCMCVLFTVVSMAFPHIILRGFTNVREVITAGTPYLRLIGCTFILSGLSSTATYLMRSVGRIKVPLIGSGLAFVLNLFFNWVFIFGKLGAPAMGIMGAAVGTVIARVIEFCINFGYFVFKEKSFSFRLRHFFLPGGGLRRQYIKFAMPVVISDFLLGLGLTLTGVIVGHIGETMSAASAIVNSLVQVSNVIVMGFAGAAAIIIGNTIGEGDIPRARRQGRTYCIMSFAVGFIMVGVFLIIQQGYLNLYEIDAETRAIANSMLLCNCFLFPIQTIAYITSKGILRGGGDSRFLLCVDSAAVWLVSIPLGILSAFVWHMAPVWIYLFLRLEYSLKGIVCFIRFCTGKWVKVIKAVPESK